MRDQGDNILRGHLLGCTEQASLSPKLRCGPFTHSAGRPKSEELRVPGPFSVFWANSTLPSLQEPKNNEGCLVLPLPRGHFIHLF